jgi:TP901 family phage tail tape measure protein
MAARLEVEISGINTGLKKSLSESLAEITRFNGALGNIKPTSVNTLNSALTTTKNLLKDLATTASSLRLSIGNRGLFESPSAELNAARTASENYRTETARLAAELQRLRLQQAQNRQQTVANSGSYTEAQRRLTALGVAIRSAEGGFRSTSPAIQAQIREYRNLNAELRRFDAQLGNHQRNVGNYKSALQGLGGLAATYFGFTAILSGGRAVIKSNAEISDSLADVRRTAGLTAKEAENLSETLKKTGSRTSLKDLLGIATVGGQLNIATDQLAGFTKAVDLLSIALGGELKGGAEGIATSLGVIDNIFKVTASNGGDVEKSYNQIGSAILQLGQSGLATGEFLSDFTQRVGGVAAQAGLSLPAILSYGAVLQENGVSAEVAGSSFKRLISALSSNSKGFFQVAKFADANLTLKQFNTIINTDTKKALDLFFAGINKGGASTVAFGTILKSLKIAGAGASQSVSALANNLPALEQHIKESTKALNNGTLAAEQGALANNTLAASIEKLGNMFTNITQSGRISNFFKGVTDGITNSLDKFNKLVNSSSWKEFWIRLTESNPIGSDIIDASKAFNEVSGKNKANQEFIFGDGAFDPDKLKNKGQAFFNQYLDKVKKTYYKSLNAYSDYAAGVQHGRIKEQDQTVEQFKFQTERAKSYYQQLLDLQNKFGFTPKKIAEKVRTDEDAPDLKGDKKAKSKAAIVNRAPEIVAQSASKEEIQGLTGVKLELEKLDQRYQKYYDDLNANASKSTEGLKTYEADIAAVRNNYEKERTKIVISESERQQSEIDRINNIAEEKLAESKAREVAEVNKRYDSEIAKANGAINIIAAIEQLKVREFDKINKDYDQKRLEEQAKLVDKITDISEKQFTLNENFSNRTTSRNKEALKERLKDIEEHFAQLKKLYANNPLALTALGIAQTGAENQTTDNFNTAENGNAKKMLQDLAVGFGNNFYRTLTTINQQADTSFTSIVGSLGNVVTGMLQDTFGTQLSGILKRFTEEGKIKFKSLGEAVAVAAGLLGGLVSGATKKTDSLGQGIGGALSGAGSGALAGASFGPQGAVIGAVVGGLAGLLGGLFGASKARKEERELQKKQLEEAQKQTEIMSQNATNYTSSITGRMTDQGVLTNVEVGAFGQLKAVVNGKQIDFILDREKNSR